ncbi:MAG: alpha/beta hydrolase [Actinomycetota bacterium]|nr:alpha/beta hydrolase [Actinomycetota bacterium]
MCIAGATGDAGHFRVVAEQLSDDFQVVTYDRRGNSRSPRPTGWTATSADEQADDAAGLIEALGIAPAAVLANSGGSIIAINLAMRYPDSLRGLIVNEPTLLGVLQDPESVFRLLQPVIQKAMESGAPRAAMEAFLGMVDVKKQDVEAVEPGLWARMLGNATTFYELEFGPLEQYVPREQALAAMNIPVMVVTGTHSAPFFARSATGSPPVLGRR